MSPPEQNGRGWKVAAILGGVICALVGAIVTGIMFHYGLVRDVGALSVGQAKATDERASLRADVNKVDITLDLMRKQIAALTRSIDRLADAQCYKDTGKPCSRAMIDERP